MVGINWNSPKWSADWLTVMASIFGTAGGASLTLAIVVELGGRLVLLIPDAIRNIRLKEKKAQQRRRREAYERFGVEVNGVVMLPRTPEVEAFLNEEEPENSSQP